VSTSRSYRKQGRRSLTTDRTRSLLREAMHRVVSGIPTNPELAKRAMDNTLRFSLSSVAQEAGVSRTLISHEDCEYSDIRAEIKELIRTKNPLAVTINQLNQDVEDLKKRVRRRRVSMSQLISRLYKKNRIATDNALQIFPVPNRLGGATDGIKGEKRETLNQQIRRLREEVRTLKRKITRRDTLYANLVLRARENDRGRHPDGRPLRPATKAERRRALSIVGSTKQ
jgi:predicted nuclease with TOPRIM domain